MNVTTSDLTSNGRATTRTIPWQRAIRIRLENERRTKAHILAKRASLKRSLIDLCADTTV
jgi:hypothetical protein